jgi:hypothetical protein
VLSSTPAAQDRMAGARTVVLPPLPEPDWPYFAAFSRLEAAEPDGPALVAQQR